MTSGWRRSVALPVALAAAAYVLAAFWVDLPPYGIWLESARSTVRLHGASAEATVELAYRCTSWRTRGTVLYLPFARSLGAVREVRAEVEDGWTWESRDDGVLLRARMGPQTTGRARFTFVQDCPQRRFRLPFPVTRGSGRPPSPAEWSIQVPPGLQVDLSPAPPKGGTGLGAGIHLVQGTTDQVLEVTWR